jgi:dihydroorotase
VCVHHLLFTDQDYERKGNLIKWNPAIKSKSDRDALVEGLLDGTIDIVATDHAPHELEKKLDNYFNAPSGGPMVEHSLVVMLELVKKNLFSLEQVVKWMCHNPARLFRIDRRGFVQNGYFADLVIVRQNAPWHVRGKEANYLVRWSPLEGEHFTDKVVTTIINGKVVYDNGVFIEENRDPMQMKFLRS